MKRRILVGVSVLAAIQLFVAALILVPNSDEAPDDDEACPSYEITIRPEGDTWACYVELDAPCKLVCAPLDKVINRLRRKTL